MKFEPPPINEIIIKCIKKIWSKYDEDNVGYLDRKQIKKFVLENMNAQKKNSFDDEEGVTDQQIEDCF